MEHKHIHKHEITSNNEQKTMIVIMLTVITMGAEILYGYITHSMALLADGYHMGTHALALGFTYIAYILIRKFKNSVHFPSGPDKIGTLTAYTSSLILAITGIWIISEGVIRLVNPETIQFNEAIAVAVIGLIVNSICIFIMEGEHSHNQEEENHCEHEHTHEIEHNHCDINEKHEKHEEHTEQTEDYNFKAAYYHILADALTSILAIFALLTGKYFNVTELDPIIGILGGILILRWAYGLLKDTIIILIDMKQ